MSKLSKRAISTLVITIFLLSIFSVAIPVNAAVLSAVVSINPDPILTGEATDIQVVVTTELDADIYTGTVTVTDPVGGTSTADISGTGLTDPGKSYVNVYPTGFLPGSAAPTTAIAGTYTVDVTVDAVTDTGTFVVNLATGTLSVDTIPVTGGVSIDGDAFVPAPRIEVLDVGNYLVTFGAVTNYITPSGQTVAVTADTTTDVLGTYVLIPQTGFTIDYVSKTTVVYGDVLTVIGSGVTAGSAVNVYWDFVTAASLLNATTGLPDGNFECEVKVPSAKHGNHYLWAKDLASGISTRSDAIFVVPKIKMSPSSGLENEEITITGYGFSDESEVTFTFGGTSLTTVPDTVETDEKGYFKCTFDVPIPGYGTYTVVATDSKFFTASADFVIGASISLDPEEGPSGKVLTITGIGWTPSDTITLTIDGVGIFSVGKTAINVGSTGKFSAKIVIPSMSKGEHTITATEVGGKGPATTEFDVTGETVIELIPGYGPPGGSVEIKGYNFTQISGTEIILDLDGVEIGGTIETDSKGEFSGNIRIPAVDYGLHDLTAIDAYALTDMKDFRIGIMIVIISPSYGPTGTPIYLTGIGFSDGKTWNATMDGVAITDEAMDIEMGTETISETIYIPTIPEGTYTITVLDIDTEIEVTSTFVVTAVTELSMDPAQAPNKYNVTVNGLNFAGKIESLDFVLYNATQEWDMNVIQTIGGTDYPAETDEDGEFTAWWEVPDDEVLSLGSYTVNVTDGEGLFTQTSFSIVEERIYIKPLKDLFNIGDTVSFDIKNDFDYDLSYMEIRDPDNRLYWRTQPFVKAEDDWLKDADLYTVPFYAQVSGGNPMTLSSDAPLGTWFWAFYTVADDQLVNGTFIVGPSAEAMLTDKIEALSEELGMDIDTLRVYIDDLGIDMDEAVSSMANEIAAAVSGMEGDISGLSEDLDDAVTGMQEDISGMGDKMTSLESLVDDISTTSTDAQGAANDAKASSDKALEAAEATQRQTSGLQGLVYGAIGASLIAALAAIVSLMQISRRIAG